MKQQVREHIRRLESPATSGLVAAQHTIDTINHPILIIGLGGTGTDALLRVKAQAHRRFAKNGQKPENIEFLSFETNEHEKKSYQGVLLESHEAVLLSNASIGAILGNRSTLPEYITSWLSPELTITDGTKGASGNRQAGRLLLFEKINAAIDAIDNKIRALRVARENKLLVFVLTGISGGTGGGMFLDIAYIIRGLMARDYGAKGIDRAEISGYLFTPDVHIAGNVINTHTEEYIQRNGYAALKELDYWMNVEERAGDRFTQRYGTRLTADVGLPPFNLCHLVSATNIDGVYLKGAYDHCLDVTAENIVNFLAQEEKTHGDAFAIHDYQSNLLANIASMKSGLPTGADHSANYVYNIIGAAAAALPTLEINAHLALRVFEELNGMFDAMPEMHDLKDFYLKAGIDAETLAANLSRRLPPLKLDYVKTDFYSHANVVKNRRVNVDEKLNALYMQVKSALRESKPEADAFIETTKNALREAFQKKGALYTARLIEGEVNPCLLAWIETTITHLQEKQHKAAEEIEMHELSAENLFESAQKAVFFNRESRKNAFIAAKIDAFQARVQKDGYAWLADTYKALHSALSAENDRFYAPISEALRSVGHALCKQNEQVNEDTPYATRIASVSSITKEASDILREMGKEALIKQFNKSLLENETRWLATDPPDVIGALSDFIYQTFGTVAARTLDDYVTAEMVETDIAPRLYREALPVFHMDNAAGMYHFPGYGMVSVPNNAPAVLQGIEAYQANMLAGHKFNIRRSAITDRIFWLNTQNGLPLFAYTPLRVYEALYERTINGKEGVGRHFWHNLPSPLPESLWGETYTNPRQKAENDRIRAIFAEAIALGNLAPRAEFTNSRYEAILREEFDAEPYIFNESTPSHTVHELIQRLRALQNNGGTPITEKRPLFNSPTEELALAHFLRNPLLVETVETENKKHHQISEILSALTALQTRRENEKTETDDFITALVCEVFVKQNGSYLYANATEEERRQPLVNLLENADHPELSLFNAYKALLLDKKEHIKRRAKVQRESYPEGKILVNLRKWHGTLALRKEALENEHDPADTTVHAFYRTILSRINTHIAALV
ncbi:MAG: tubulin-like doman-containing protein [Defluviitaleaceae bacterium]|nr:tubulin-like doman-containing protein [Defluviitaleaceae bacterium]MCL2275741.1 tubulin-like doman-containing protein [Defluviitaleaceae bacterium]